MGKNISKTKKPVINLLEFNECNEPGCKCGWNLRIGSDDYFLSGKIQAYLEEIAEVKDLRKEVKRNK